MRRFLALFGRELRDARWNLVASFAIAAAAPFVLYGLLTDRAPDVVMSQFGGRVLVPLLFALFAMATASDLVARELATRRIDVLAALPVPGARVWTAKAVFLGVASAAFLAWAIAWEVLAVNAIAPSAYAQLIEQLGAAVPSLLAGLACGAAALFFSTLMERGMTAAIAAIVALTAVAWSIQWAEMPAYRGEFTQFVACAVPLAIAAAFAVASRVAFVRGPVHGPSKLRVALNGLVALAALLIPSGACLALGLEAASRLPAGAGDPNLRAAFVSADEKWVAVQDLTDRGLSQTWLVGLADGSCRDVYDSPTWIAEGAAWLPGSMLCVHTSSFSVLDGPCHLRRLEIEPTRLGVADERWVRRDETSEASWAPRWAWVVERRKTADGRSILTVSWHGGSKRFACRDVVPSPIADVLFLISESGALTRVNVRDGTSVEVVHEGVKSALVGPWEGLLLFVETTSGMRIHDANTGATLVDSLGPRAHFPFQIGPGRRVVVSTVDAAGNVATFAARDLTTGTVVEFGAPRLTDRVPRVTWLKDGRFVVVDGDVTLRDTDGRTIRRLFPPNSEEK